MKRSLSLVLVLAFLVSLFSCPALAAYDPDYADINFYGTYGQLKMEEDGSFSGTGVFRIDTEIPMDVQKTVWVMGSGDPAQDVFAWWKLDFLFEITEIDSFLICYCDPLSDRSWDKSLMVLVTEDQFRSVPLTDYDPSLYFQYFTVRYASQSLYPRAALWVKD